MNEYRSHPTNVRFLIFITSTENKPRIRESPGTEFAIRQGQMLHYIPKASKKRQSRNIGHKTHTIYCFTAELWGKYWKYCGRKLYVVTTIWIAAVVMGNMPVWLADVDTTSILKKCILIEKKPSRFWLSQTTTKPMHNSVFEIRWHIFSLLNDLWDIIRIVK